MPTTVRDIIRRLEADGWTVVATKGSRRQFIHPVKKGRVTIPGKLGADLQMVAEHLATSRAEGLTRCDTRW